MNLVSLLAKRCGGGGSGEAGPDHDDGVFTSIRRVYQLHFEAALIPLLLDRAGRNSRVEHLILH